MTATARIRRQSNDKVEELVEEAPDPDAEEAGIPRWRRRQRRRTRQGSCGTYPGRGGADPSRGSCGVDPCQGGVDPGDGGGDGVGERDPGQGGVDPGEVARIQVMPMEARIQVMEATME